MIEERAGRKWRKRANEREGTNERQGRDDARCSGFKVLTWLRVWLWSFAFWSGSLLARIFYTAMIDGNQRFGETLLDKRQLFQREPALIKLTVKQPLHRQLIHKVFDASRALGPARHDLSAPQ